MLVVVVLSGSIVETQMRPVGTFVNCLSASSSMQVICFSCMMDTVLTDGNVWDLAWYLVALVAYRFVREERILEAAGCVVATLCEIEAYF